MAFKEWFQKLRPMQLYIMLTLTGLFFAVELIISHLTHSLTLLVDSYHMLCNIIALAGWVITIKVRYYFIYDSYETEVSYENYVFREFFSPGKCERILAPTFAQNQNLNKINKNSFFNILSFITNFIDDK